MAARLDRTSLRLVELALDEDLSGGDVTSDATIVPGTPATGALLAKEPCVLAGLAVAREVFRQVDPSLRFEAAQADGARLEAGTVFARVHGPTHSVLTGERTALNFLRHLTGVATQTARFVEAAGNPAVRLVDTRKTTPGMRALEKAAVRAGGGHNHRFALGDGVLIKDNHIVAAGGISRAIERARAHAHHLLRIEIEVEDLPGLREALDAGADVVMLDNMTPEQVAEAVQVCAGRALLEASGNMRLETIGAYAATGVDLISVGSLIHSVPDADLSLNLEPLEHAQ